MNLKKKLHYNICILSSIVIILSLMLFLGIFSNAQKTLADNLYGGKTASKNIIILAIDDKSLQEIGRWPWNREVFSKLISKLDDASAVAVDVAFFEPSSPGNDTALYTALKNSKNTVLTMEYASFNHSNGLVYGESYILPLTWMNGSPDNVMLGYVNVVTDTDGITRSVNTNIQGTYQSLVVQMYKKIFGKIPDEAIKTSLLINYVNHPHSYTEYSISDVINDRINNSIFKDKIIFIGATAPDLHDDYFVPTSNGHAMPGVEVHANTLQMLMSKDYISNINILITIILILLFSSLIFWLNNKIGVTKTGILGVVIIIAYIFAAIITFDNGKILNLVYIPLSIIISYVASTGFLYATEKHQKRKIKEAFQKYVSKDVVEELIKNPEKLKLGGEKKNITIMFSDIRSFTSLSEKLTPEELVRILNQYLTAMTNIILKNKGCVDKYIGDAIMALWNVPLTEKEHARLSCMTALEMVQSLEALNKKFKDEKISITIDIGVGINTGTVIAGNMGSDERFDYTAIGDSVNTASRLEGLNKVYSTKIIISEHTLAELEHHAKEFTIKELDYVAVKGKVKPMRIFELVGTKDVSEEKLKQIKLFENALKSYRSQKWDLAIEQFSKANDPSSKMFIERCKLLKETPPGAEWDYAWHMTEK